MSVINRMLQDLDARAGRQDGAAVPDGVTVVAARAAPLRRVVVIVLVGVLVAVGAVGAVALRLARAPVSKSVAVASAPVVKAAPVVKTIVLDAVPAAAVADPGPAPVVAAVPEPVAVLRNAGDRPAGPVPGAVHAAGPAAVRAAVPAPAVSNGATRVDSPYRRALALLSEGRKGEAIAALEEALRGNPRDGAARETLVGLLIEGQRGEEAMAQLQAALALDARQPAMAMLLARLQIGQGGDGIDTLLRSLPFAGDDAGYHAFLAGAFQRRQRNAEAVAQYQAALQLAPNNGVWLMGLGLSLRADGKKTQAIEALRAARASGSLSPELDAYVERQLSAAD